MLENPPPLKTPEELLESYNEITTKTKEESEFIFMEIRNLHHMIQDIWRWKEEIKNWQDKITKALEKLIDETINK